MAIPLDIELTSKGIPHTLRPAFQEYDLEQLDPVEDQFSVIERTLAYGQRQEIRWLFQKYGKPSIVSWIREAGWRLLPRRRLLFWAAYFEISDLSTRSGAWPH
jgi:hypothetical protein